MKNILLPAVLLAAAGVTGAAHASFVDFANDPDSTTGDTGVASITFDSITATSYYDPTNTNTWLSDTSATLWRRNNTNDHGLGVCSSGERTAGNCTNNGNYNELSQLDVNEAIGLTKANTTDTWTGLWVSSLDYSSPGGVFTPESGTLWYGDGAADAIIGGSNSFVFAYDDFGFGVFEGNLFDLLDVNQKSAIGAASNLYFTPTGGVGDDNDYLVWAAATEGGEFPSEVPVPAAVWLFGSGLLGLVGIARRRKV